MLNDIQVIQLDSILKYYKNCLDEDNSSYFAECSGKFTSSLSVNQGIECVKVLEIKKYKKVPMIGQTCEITVDVGKLTMTEKDGLQINFPSIEANYIKNEQIMSTAREIFEKHWHMDDIVKKATEMK